MNTIRIGTRGSQLALWQAGEVSKMLMRAGYRCEIVRIRTMGDERQDVSLASIGGKGLFIKELEQALDRREIDIAVHSLKDVPSIIPTRFRLAGFLKRADPRDAWVHPANLPIQDLHAGAVVGTSSPRRRAQLMTRFPHLTIESIRGNVETRIDKTRAGPYDGVVLACAGLSRLGRDRDITYAFTVDEIVPAAGQGIVCMEILAARTDALNAATAINDPDTEIVAHCERGVLQQFGEQLDCYSAIAVHATVDDGVIAIRAFAGDGTHSVRVYRYGRDAAAVIRSTHQLLVEKDALDLLFATAV